MHVVATAGHVDHGKSTLLRSLTGMEPDRWAEEQRRAMTLDLGFVWTTTEDGTPLAFVDVPGHERFITTMLAGVGPVPAALVVVAADAGWQEQTSEHAAILDALQVRHGVLAVTRADLADPEPMLRYAAERLAHTSLGQVEAVAVSAHTGAGLPALRAALTRMTSALPAPDPAARVRFFVDRAFTIKGSGTVVTGTLGAGRIAPGDTLQLGPGGRPVRVRGLQMLNQPVEEALPVARVAVNLRDVAVEEVPRGSVLLTPASWPATSQVDVRLDSLAAEDLPGDLLFHIGSDSVPARARGLGEDTARVTLAYPMPLEPGDVAVLRDPSRRLVTGLVVLDVDPPEFTRRGAAARRAAALEDATGTPDPVVEVARRGAVTRARLAALGVLPEDAPLPAGLREIRGYAVDPVAWTRWGEQLIAAVDADHQRSPITPGLSTEAARQALGVPDARLVDELVREQGGRLVSLRGRVTRPGTGPVFDEPTAAALDAVSARLDADPLDAPNVTELEQLGLGTKVLGAAAGQGRFLRLAGDVLIHPRAVDEVVATLASLPQPFTMSEARQALGVSRRVAMPLLEHLDATGRSARVDGNRRRVRGD